jgi:hypothetical protein
MCDNSRGRFSKLLSTNSAVMRVRSAAEVQRHMDLCLRLVTGGTCVLPQVNGTHPRVGEECVELHGQAVAVSSNSARMRRPTEAMIWANVSDAMRQG